MTSTSGVTLMSDLTPPFAPPRSIAMGASPERRRAGRHGAHRPGPSLSRAGSASRPCQPRQASCSLLDEVVDQLGRGVVHLDVEVLDAAGQVVVEPHGRDGHDQSERRLDERFGNTGRHRADAARPRGGDTLERRDDADDRAEQSDERGGRADGRERGDALLQVVGRERGGALDGAAHRVEQVVAVEARAASPAGTGTPGGQRAPPWRGGCSGSSSTATAQSRP